VIRRRDLSRPVADDVLPVLRDETSALLDDQPEAEPEDSVTAAA
jgi:hypothetical protein